MDIDLLKYKKVNDLKKQIISDLKISVDECKSYITKLHDYKYVDEVCDITDGAYIRCINCETNKLNNGGIVCAVDFDKKDVIITCKNFRNQFFVIYLSGNHVFQKMDEMEQLVMGLVLDFERKNSVI